MFSQRLTPYSHIRVIEQRDNPRPLPASEPQRSYAENHTQQIDGSISRSSDSFSRPSRTPNSLASHHPRVSFAATARAAELNAARARPILNNRPFADLDLSHPSIQAEMPKKTGNTRSKHAWRKLNLSDLIDPESDALIDDFTQRSSEFDGAHSTWSRIDSEQSYGDVGSHTLSPPRSVKRLILGREPSLDRPTQPRVSTLASEEYQSPLWAADQEMLEPDSYLTYADVHNTRSHDASSNLAKQSPQRDLSFGTRNHDMDAHPHSVGFAPESVGGKGSSVCTSPLHAETTILGRDITEESEPESAANYQPYDNYLASDLQALPPPPGLGYGQLTARPPEHYPAVKGTATESANRSSQHRTYPPGFGPPSAHDFHHSELPHLRYRSSNIAGAPTNQVRSFPAGTTLHSHPQVNHSQDRNYINRLKHTSNALPASRFSLRASGTDDTVSAQRLPHVLKSSYHPLYDIPTALQLARAEWADARAARIIAMKEDWERSNCSDNKIADTETDRLPKALEQASENAVELLLPALLRLSSYVQGDPIHRRDPFHNMTARPAWAIDHSPGANKSFFEDHWGAPPRRLARDPRYSRLHF